MVKRLRKYTHSSKKERIIMVKEYQHLSEIEIIRMAELERSKAISKFIRKLFSKKKNVKVPSNTVPAE